MADFAAWGQRALLLISLAAPVAAQAQSCPPAGARPPDKTVTVSTHMEPPVYSGELTAKKITALAGREGADPKSPNAGLTLSLADVKLTPQTWGYDLGGGKFCVGLGRVEAQWRLAEIKVYIASEYSPGGCNYAKVRAHEDEHVAISREAFMTWKPRVEQGLRDAAARLGPRVVAASQRQIAAKAMVDALMDGVQPAMAGFKAELRTRNSAIDTAANYRLIMSKCPNW